MFPNYFIDAPAGLMYIHLLTCHSNDIEDGLFVFHWFFSVDSIATTRVFSFNR